MEHRRKKIEKNQIHTIVCHSKCKFQTDQTKRKKSGSQGTSQHKEARTKCGQNKKGHCGSPWVLLTADLPV